jgi:hypothetical protein
VPSNDGVRLHEHDRRAPVPPDSGQRDPEQSIARLETRAGGCAFQGRQLLPQPPGSPRPIPGRGAPAPAHGRLRSAAPACVDRGWRRLKNQRRRVLAMVRSVRFRLTCDLFALQIEAWGSCETGVRRFPRCGGRVHGLHGTGSFHGLFIGRKVLRRWVPRMTVKRPSRSRRTVTVSPA